MSDYHRVYMKLVDLLERGHLVQVEKRHNDFEVTVFEPMVTRDHFHTEGEFLSEAMDEAHRIALQRWPKDD